MCCFLQNYTAEAANDRMDKIHINTHLKSILTLDTDLMFLFVLRLFLI